MAYGFANGNIKCKVKVNAWRVESGHRQSRKRRWDSHQQQQQQGSKPPLETRKNIHFIWVFLYSARKYYFKTLVVDLLRTGQAGWFTVWENGEQNSGKVNFVPDSRLPFVQISFIYQKTAAKAWNWYQGGFEVNGTRISFGTFCPEKQDCLFRSSVAPGKFLLEWPKRSCSLYFATRFSGNFFVNGKQPFLISFGDEILHGHPSRAKV